VLVSSPEGVEEAMKTLSLLLAFGIVQMYGGAK
jgi:hypothetical protein